MSENTGAGPSTAARDGKNRLALPFDQYQRYRVISDSLDLLRENDEPLRVLDVGGAEGVILNFLAGDEVTILDVEVAEGVPNFVAGDATAMPFDDGSFDYAISVDVYEHIPEDQREAYLSELRRVAHKGVLMAAPFDSDEVRGAERLANEFHRSVHLEANRWLDEHAENGLPDLEGSVRFFEGAGDRVTVIPNGYLPHWIAMISLTFYESHLQDGLEGISGRLNNFYNEFLYGHDNAEPSYRHVVISLKEGRDADFGSLATPAAHPNPAISAALFSTFSSTLALAPEIKGMNRQLAQKDGQLAQKEAQIRDLSRRLAQQTATANTVVMLRQENAKLKRDLAAIKGSRAWQLVERQRNVRISLRNRLGRGDG